MPAKKSIRITIALLATVFIVFALSPAVDMSIDFTYADAGSLVQQNYYPTEGASCESVTHFWIQISAVNTNTTFSVQIDDGLPIPMIYQGIKTEIASNGNELEWHSWQITVPAITAPGEHTFQFLSHYYVWQEVDKYWAEFNAQSENHHFTINSPFNASTAKTQNSHEVDASTQASAPLSEIAGIIVVTAAIFALAITIFNRHLRKKPNTQQKML